MREKCGRNFIGGKCFRRQYPQSKICCKEIIRKEYPAIGYNGSNFRKQDRFSQRVNPKFCVGSISGANQAKFIQGGSRGIRLPPIQQHNAGGVGCQGQRSRLSCP